MPSKALALEEYLKELRIIPGVGKSIAKDLYDLGIRSVADLRDKNPEELYHRSNQLAGAVQGPCLLYTFRCAVYFAREKQPDPKLLKWWNWKDRKLM